VHHILYIVALSLPLRGSAGGWLMGSVVLPCVYVGYSKLNAVVWWQAWQVRRRRETKRGEEGREEGSEQ